jgi:hypothetical protein
MSRLFLHLLVRFSVPKQLFAPSKTMADSPTDIDGVFAFKRQNVAKERFYSVVHLPPPPLASLACAFFQSGRALQLRQLRHVCRDPPRFILREHFAALLVADDKAGVQFLDRPGRGGKRRAGMA